jgi:hypothetical protein
MYLKWKYAKALQLEPLEPFTFSPKSNKQHIYADHLLLP